MNTDERVLALRGVGTPPQAALLTAMALHSGYPLALPGSPL